MADMAEVPPLSRLALLSTAKAALLTLSPCPQQKSHAD